MFFEIFLATYLAIPGTPTPPESAEVRDCFYNYFLRLNGQVVGEWLSGFERSLAKTMHYFRALHAANMVTKKALNHVVTEQCQLSLMKMEDCALCAGYSAVFSPSCNGLCLNILRGCLLDLSDLVEPILSFSQVFVAMKDHISEFSFFGQVELLESHVFTMIGSTSDYSFRISHEVSYWAIIIISSINDY